MCEREAAAVPFEIRAAVPGDEVAIAGLIHELAEYERLSDECTVTPESLRAHLFAERPAVEALVATSEGETVAYALFFSTFSTFLGQPGLYLEDLYVKPAHRKRGIGGACLTALGRICRERGCARLEWAVLTWNELAARQYRKLGAAPLEDWRTWRLTGEALERLAQGSGGA
ncbi:GNAT family N-acetyltransferase [Candidatus Sumerlaeota bacterium]|nr:GNAT family N-acetyltransferase [Candidatus Sumerlaeota bacterium]